MSKIFTKSRRRIRLESAAPASVWRYANYEREICRIFGARIIGQGENTLFSATFLGFSGNAYKLTAKKKVRPGKNS
jgi:hypothetical protein